MEKIYSFEKLKIWQIAHQHMLQCYKFANEHLPPDEKYNRIIQLKRCASSVPANIAEGFGRYHYLENIQFCRIARGSLDELKNHLIAARDLLQAPKDDCDKLIKNCDNIKLALNCYIRELNRLYKQK